MKAVSPFTNWVPGSDELPGIPDRIYTCKLWNHLSVLTKLLNWNYQGVYEKILKSQQAIDDFFANDNVYV